MRAAWHEQCLAEILAEVSIRAEGDEYAALGEFSTEINSGSEKAQYFSIMLWEICTWQDTWICFTPDWHQMSEESWGFKMSLVCLEVSDVPLVGHPWKMGVPGIMERSWNMWKQKADQIKGESKQTHKSGILSILRRESRILSAFLIHDAKRLLMWTKYSFSFE